jgi:hypothetical protein
MGERVSSAGARWLFLVNSIIDLRELNGHTCCGCTHPTQGTRGERAGFRVTGSQLPALEAFDRHHSSTYSLQHSISSSL